jgi:hypothetical protein
MNLLIIMILLIIYVFILFYKYKSSINIMCSLEEAWGTSSTNSSTSSSNLLGGRQVVSQGDIHDGYIHTPDDLFTQQLMPKNQTPPKRMVPGEHVKSRVSTPNVSSSHGNFSFITDDNTTPLPNPVAAPSYIADQIQPGSELLHRSSSNSLNASSFDSAFQVSEDVNRYMRGSANIDGFASVNSQQQQRQPTKEKFEDNAAINMMMSQNMNTARDIMAMLEKISHRIDNMESTMQKSNNKNVHDIILYTVFGILLAVVIYAIICQF